MRRAVSVRDAPRRRHGDGGLGCTSAAPRLGELCCKRPERSSWWSSSFVAASRLVDPDCIVAVALVNLVVVIVSVLCHRRLSSLSSSSSGARAARTPPAPAHVAVVRTDKLQVG